MSMSFAHRAIALSVCALPMQAGAQTPVEQPVVATTAACCTIPALTEIEIEVLATLNSQANKIGEKFALRLAQPIVVDGKTLVPAGATGSGDVVHAAKSRFGGKPGEMILAARYIEHGGIRIPLRSLRPMARGQGKDNTETAAIVGIAVAPVLSMFITGGEVNVPQGTIMTAKVSAATLLPAPATTKTTTEGTPDP